MEELCVAVALQLQLEDLETFTNARKGKEVEGSSKDEDLALEMYKVELESLDRFLHDLKLAQSIVRAVETDAEIIRTAREDEDRAIRDRRIACTLGGLGQPKKPPREDFMVLDPADKILEGLARLNGSVSGKNERRTNSFGSPSSSKAAEKEGSSHSRDVSRQACVACREQKHDFDIMRAPCGDHYCRDCVVSLFMAALTDESLFPPRCCRQTIGVELAKDFLEPAIQAEFRMKTIEHSTSNRTYCHHSWCSQFIPPSGIAVDVGTCTCGARTCTICKGAAHSGDCPDDPATRETLALAAANGWRQCSGCKRMVELAFGCNHITCHCGAQFCYVCGSRWKTCLCAQWDDNRLLNRAAVVVQREPRREANPVIEEQRVADMADRLRNGHECLHESWRYVQGRHDCEECAHTLPEYIFECRQCRIRACNRCRRNRL